MKTKLALAIAGLAAFTTNVGAFELDTGDNWDVRWDNSFRFNIASRVSKIDDDVLRGDFTLLSSDPTLAFLRSDAGIITTRVDLISEFDAVWRETAGFRVSGAAWYDFAYADGMDQPDSISAHWSNPSVPVGELNDAAEELHYRGAEFLDAFAFFNFDMGDAAASIRAGRHSIYWGSSLLLTGAVHSVGGSMNTIDAAKGFSVPGSEAKELFRPTNQISTVIQMTDNATVSAYYGLEWENYRLPVGTTYFSPADGLTEDTEMVHLAAPDLNGDGIPDLGIGVQMQGDEHPEEGEFGINFEYYFENSGLELSVYYLNYHSKVQDGLIGVIHADQGLAVGLFDAQLAGAGFTPQEIAFFKQTFGAPPTPVALNQISIGEVKWAYKEDVDLFGLSLSKQIGSVSYGMDLTHRQDAPIRLALSQALQRFDRVPAPFQPLLGPGIDFDAADESTYSDYFTTGDTWHLVVNALGLLNDNGFWEGGSFVIEATVSMLDSLNSRPELVNVTDRINVKENDIVSHLAVNFNPTWYQVRPGVDMTVKASVGVGLAGNSAIGFGGDDGVGSGALGAEFNVDQKWTADIRYNFYFGDYNNGIAGLWKDRDNISLTLKRTF